MHDLRRLVDLVGYFQVDASCVINKIDLNEEAGREIEGFCNERGIDVIATISYSRVFPDSLQNGRTIMEMDDPHIERKIGQIWNYLATVE